jgi:hypothetical protein
MIMKKILEFLDKWGSRISTVMVLIIFLKTCSTNTRVDKVRLETNKTNEKIDSMTIQLRKEIRIEGLESERRMIQSTDRDIMDVNRQSKIGEIIDSLRIQK